MPARSRDLHLEFELIDCSGWVEPEDLLETLKLVINTGLIPLEARQRVEIGEQRLAHPVADNVDKWFSRNYSVKTKGHPLNEGWETEILNALDSKEYFIGRFRIPLQEEWRTEEPLWGAIEISIDARNYGELPSSNTSETFNYINFYCTLFGKSFTNSNSELHYVDDVTNTLLNFAKAIIQRLKPAYALITDQFYCQNSGKDIQDARIRYIYWCNYFGPSYIKRYGKEIFLSVPIGKIEQLGDGVWYQMSERMSGYWDKNLRERVAKYFSSMDVEVAGDIVYFG